MAGLYLKLGRKPEGPQLSLELEWGLGGGREVAVQVSCRGRWPLGRGCQRLCPAVEVFVGGEDGEKAVSQQVSIGL